jgi:hypothetical protein
MRTRRSARTAIGVRWAIAWAAACTATAGDAAARDGDRIVLATTDATSTTSRRLQAELASMGLEVVVTVLPSAVESRAAIERAARSANAMAAIYVVAQGTRAELWIVDRVTNKTVIREIVASDSSRGNADDAIAVGVAELLRASLLEVETKKPAQGEYPATARVHEIARPSEGLERARGSRFWLDVGSGAELGLRGTGPSALARVAIGWQGPSGFGLEALASTTLVPAKVERAQGSATVSSHWVGSAATFQWQPAGSVVSGRVGLGALAVRLEARGEAIAPLVSSAPASWTFGPYLHGGPAIGSSSFRVRLDLGVLFAVRTPRIRFADETVATWGQPALFATLGLEAAP